MQLQEPEELALYLALAQVLMQKLEPVLERESRPVPELAHGQKQGPLEEQVLELEPEPVLALALALEPKQAEVQSTEVGMDLNVGVVLAAVQGSWWAEQMGTGIVGADPALVDDRQKEERRHETLGPYKIEEAALIAEAVQAALEEVVMASASSPFQLMRQAGVARTNPCHLVLRA